MILGIGTDIVSVDRIGSLFKSSGDRFLDRILSNSEKAQIQDPGRNKISYLAKRFAGKEAFSKAIGLGMGRGVNFNDVAILNDSNGKPYVELNSDKRDFLKNYFGVEDFVVHISVSDEADYAIAYCVVEQIK